MAVKFKCKVCGASAKFVEITFPEFGDSITYSLQNKIWKNGQTITVDEAVVLFYEGKYYILIDCADEVKTKMSMMFYWDESVGTQRA